MLNLLVQRFSWFRYGLVLGVLGLTSLLSVAQNTPTARYDTVAEMLAARVPSSANTRISALVTGRLTANDGGGGIFFYDPSSGVSTNLGTIFKPNDNNGRWIRQYDGPVNFSWFGPDTSGSVNSSSRFVDFLSVVSSSGKSGYVNYGSYRVTPNMLLSYSNLELTSPGATFFPDSYSNTVFRFRGNNIKLEGIVFDGNSNSVRGIQFETNTSNVLISGCTFKNLIQGTGETLSTAGIRIKGYTTNFTVIGCTFKDINANQTGISRGFHATIDASDETIPKDIKILNSFFTRIGPVNDADAIVLQGWESSVYDCGFLIQGNYCYDVKKRFAKIQLPGGQVVNNYIVNPNMGSGFGEDSFYAGVSVYANNVQVTGNSVIGGAINEGVELGSPLVSVTNVIVSGNSIIPSPLVNPTTEATDGISVYGQIPSTVTISGNIVKNTRIGVRIASGLTGATIAGNVIDGATQSGIVITGDGSHIPSRVSITGNSFTNITQYGINMAEGNYLTANDNVGVAGFQLIRRASGVDAFFWGNSGNGIVNNYLDSLGLGDNPTGAKLHITSDLGDHIRLSRTSMTDRFIGLASGDYLALSLFTDVSKGLIINTNGLVTVGRNTAGTARLSVVDGWLRVYGSTNSSPQNGDFWQDNQSGELRFRQNGVTVPLSNALIVNIGAACSDETTPVTTGAGKVTFRSPSAFTLTGVRASLTTAQSSGSIFTVNIKQNGASVLSTKITIDNGATTSTTATTPPVISTSAITDDAQITVDVDQVGDGTATGLKVWLIGTR